MNWNGMEEKMRTLEKAERELHSIPKPGGAKGPWGWQVNGQGMGRVRKYLLKLWLAC
jgi:hypothetical protein